MKTKNLFPVLLLLILVTIWGCEKEYDNVVENQIVDYQVINVVVKDSLQYPIDSSAVFRIEFNKVNDISNVMFDLYSPENSKLISQSELFDNGKTANGDITANDKIYSAKISLDSNLINGDYEIKLFVKDKLSSTKQIATTKYHYNNGKDNVAPVISDDIIDPDTLVVDTIKVIWCNVKATDANGKNDIQKVYFVVYKPDGTTNNFQWELFDDGNISSHGDLIANDGIYSFLISVNQSNDKGAYRFEFSAKDRSNKLSNIINHTVLIQ